MMESSIHEEGRRAGFVENLLNIDRSGELSSGDVPDIYLYEQSGDSCCPRKQDEGLVHS